MNNEGREEGPVVRNCPLVPIGRSGKLNVVEAVGPFVRSTSCVMSSSVKAAEADVGPETVTSSVALEPHVLSALTKVHGKVNSKVNEDASADRAISPKTRI